jgi:hypothetical protein
MKLQQFTWDPRKQAVGNRRQNPVLRELCQDRLAVVQHPPIFRSDRLWFAALSSDPFEEMPAVPLAGSKVED